MSKFEPLTAMRQIRDDHRLTYTQAHILMCIVLRTTNATRHVPWPQEHLAVDAGVSIRTMKNFYATEIFQEYFQITRRGRSVVLHWIPAMGAAIGAPIGAPKGASPAPSSATATANASSNKENEVVETRGAAVPADYEERERWMQEQDHRLEEEMRRKLGRLSLVREE